MKKLLIIVLLIFILFGVVGNSSALQLVGWVKPVFNPDNITGTAQYYFNLYSTPGDVLDYINYFSLSFFSSAFASVSNLSGAPSGMSLIGVGYPGIEWGYSPTPLLYAGSGFSFSIDFKLQYARGTPNYLTMWGPGNSPWMQDFTAFGMTTLPSGNFYFQPAGGSTALVPEPATLLLLGTGFFGFGLFGALRRKRV